jgi:hypothetical protein
MKDESFQLKSDEEKRECIFNTIDSLIADFLYYQRKEDSELGVGDIEDTIRDGIISVEEIINKFVEILEDNL